ncbi:hypothetical protein H8356DRAFT_1416960 [Neocallimastix lanati (nom. inval.)]|jgi:hypothetical protein|uniref:Tubby C-terminal domain-containing protein n=1 Tax=Neocallimastix californiae TaxID=1754190 RepID=A0A1Y2EMS7_9FUNG|nr:hypothetical protein H8356DRAFT_1416960 [Neocallimastix sp. JGI-2020a]ORY72837.1 hypothetical protein LY90DRAFT_503516 [Neocallimastix californiae]|eukprot:ORY72837.1 hypothetical protein LY90DRAFT_503516 [Neocallimastix californiae]
MISKNTSDNTISKDFDNFIKEIGKPNHEIIALDSKYICSHDTIYCFREGFSNYTSNTLVILDNENKEIYNCEIKGNTTIIYDKNGDPILNTCFNINKKSFDSTFEETINISEGKDLTNSKYGIMKSTYKLNRHTLVPINLVYKIEFLNLYNNKLEKLEVRLSNEIFGCYFIYCNPGEKNETLICKIKKEKRNKKYYTIEVAAGVDYMYMLAFCVSINYSIHIAQKRYF